MATSQETLDGDSEPWKDREKLDAAYHGDGLKQAEIADKWGTTGSNISYWMKKHGIDTSHTKHDPDPTRRGPETCTRCGEKETPGGASTANKHCDDCVDEYRADGAGVTINGK